MNDYDVIVMGAAAGVDLPAEDVYDWQLPQRFGEPSKPANNPMSPAKVD